jgi:hypothetical protein
VFWAGFALFAVTCDTTSKFLDLGLAKHELYMRDYFTSI